MGQNKDMKRRIVGQRSFDVPPSAGPILFQLPLQFHANA
jgi:hypothetical protein